MRLLLAANNQATTRNEIINVATRTPFLSEAAFEKLFRTHVGANYFVDDFVSCWGKRGANRLLLEPS